ncbi:MAG: DUF4381 family protein [Planctomycetia bacterium]|nr:DUF4381 family protein [Planctomycetia bacterium]
MLLFACGFALLAAAPVERSERLPGPAGAVVRAELDRDALSLSEALTLTLTVEGRAPLEMEPVKLLTSSRVWLVTPLAEPEFSSIPDQRMRWRQSYRLEPLQADKAVALPLEPIRFRSDGQQASVTLKPFTVAVSTVVLGPSLGALKDNTPPEELPAAVEVPWLLYGAAGAVVALVLVGGLLLRRRWRRSLPPPPELPADQWALRELSRLDGAPLTSPDDVHRYHAALAEVVRTYLERRFGLQASKQTTREFLAALRQAAVLPDEQQDQLRSVLERCDLAKFARLDYSPSDCRASAQQTRDFVSQSATRPAEPATVQS